MNSIDDNNRCKTIYGILLVLFIIAFNCIWLNKAYPMAEGWAEIYSGLLDNGKIPYKDFYYYLPPLNLLIDYIIWKLSFGFIVIYRLWRLLERIAIIGIIYKILINNMKPFYALLVSLLGCFIGSGCCYDLCGDYNQTEVLTALLLGLSLIKYIQYPDNPKNKTKWAIIAGIIGGIMFLQKQPIVLSGFIIFSLLLLLFKYCKLEKNILKTFCLVIIGAAIPLGIATIFLIATGSFNDFINQVFLDISSKSTSLFDLIICKQIKSCYTNFRLVSPFILIYVALLIPININKKLCLNNIIRYSLITQGKRKLFLDVKHFFEVFSFTTCF